MKKIAICCSGQGSQYVGQTTKVENLEYYSRANEALGFNLKEICTNGPVEKINETAITQPALLTHSWSQYNEFLKPLLDKVSIEFVLGHSVGEYAALTIANVFEFEDAIKAVNLRGQAMQEATPLGVGSMFAILKLEPEVIEEACKAVSNEDFQVSVANNNSPGQLVISGHKEACAKAVEYLKEKLGNVRAIELKVSAPFHSPLMMPAQKIMESFLSDTKLVSNNIPYIANIDAQAYSIGTATETIKNNLVEQVSGQVQWTKSIQKLKEQGIDTVIELGPGKTLKGLIKRIDPTITTYSFDLEDDRKAFRGVI